MRVEPKLHHSLHTLDCIQPWLDDGPDTHIVFHYVPEVVSLLEHNLIHLQTSLTRVEAGKDPPRSLAFSWWLITFLMLDEWVETFRLSQYMENNFLHLMDKIGNKLAPSHVKGRPWLFKT